MKKLVNLEKALVVAIANPILFAHTAFAMFYVKDQCGDILNVIPVWKMGCPDMERGNIHPSEDNHEQLSVDDVMFCVSELNAVQKAHLDNLGLDYRFHKDEDALARLAKKLDLDLMHIGYDGESNEGTWFTCLRIDNAIRNMIPSNFHIYSLRADDEDDSQAASIEEKVYVNHYGDILTNKPLPVPVELEVEDIQYDEEGNIIG